MNPFWRYQGYGIYLDMPFRIYDIARIIESRTGVRILGKVAHGGIGIDGLASSLVTICPVRKGGRVVQVTSSIPEEGKSYISAALGSALTRLDYRVVLIETDMHHVQPQSTPGGAVPAGLARYLADPIAETSQVLCVSAPLALAPDRVPCGTAPSNPYALLSSLRMNHLIDELRLMGYDYILMDSPPCLAVPDAYSLDRLADLNIYVVRAGLMELFRVRNLLKIRSAGRLSDLMAVINDTRI